MEFWLIQRIHYAAWAAWLNRWEEKEKYWKKIKKKKNPKEKLCTRWLDSSEWSRKNGDLNFRTDGLMCFAFLWCRIYWHNVFNDRIAKRCVIRIRQFDFSWIADFFFFCSFGFYDLFYFGGVWLWVRPVLDAFDTLNVYISFRMTQNQQIQFKELLFSL